MGLLGSFLSRELTSAGDHHIGVLSSDLQNFPDVTFPSVNELQQVFLRWNRQVFSR